MISLTKNISSIQFFSNFFSKNVAFTKFLLKKCDSKSPYFHTSLWCEGDVSASAKCCAATILSQNFVKLTFRDSPKSSENVWILVNSWLSSYLWAGNLLWLTYLISFVVVWFLVNSLPIRRGQKFYKNSHLKRCESV